MTAPPRPARGSYRVGLDIGGTFTDLAAVDHDSGETFVAKVPSTPQAPADAILDALTRFSEKLGIRRDNENVNLALFLGALQGDGASGSSPIPTLSMTTTMARLKGAVTPGYWCDK